MGSTYTGPVICYIQRQLAAGRQPNADGFYVFAKKELVEKTGMSPSAFSGCKDDVVNYFKTHCDLAKWAKFEEYPGEILYVDVSYERGILRFRQNPITKQEPFSRVWAMPPLRPYFTYDYFDSKHRRRINWHEPVLDAIPWGWDADLYEKMVCNGDSIKLLEMMKDVDESSIIMQQAKKANAVCDVSMVSLGYRPNTISNVLYSAVRGILPELCEFALKNGADPNMVIQQGYTSMNAISGLGKEGADWEKIVKMLIDAGGDLTCGNFNTSSFAGDVFSKGSDELCMYYIEALKNAGLLNTTSVTGCSPLSAAKIYKGESSPITKLIEDYLH